jgi:hypothetical protein
MSQLKPTDVGHETEKTTTTSKDGATTTTEKTKWTIGTADLALVIVFLLSLVLFVMSLFVNSMRDGLNGALPVLLGVFTVAVGGTEAFKILRRTS